MAVSVLHQSKAMREYEKESGVDPEATVVRPLFTEDEAVVARPVVPLGDREMVRDVDAYVETGTAPPGYGLAVRRRTHWTAALVAAALFAGTVLGIIGLRIYQNSSADAETQTPAQQQTTETSAADAPAATEPQPAPAQPSLPETSRQAPAEAPAITREETEALPAPPASAPAAEDREPRERQTAAAETRPRVVGEETRAEAPVRHGRKGENEDERARYEPPRRDGVYDTQGSAPEGSAAERRAAREEERLRRVERIERRRERRGRREAYMVDSIRGVFEGRRESPPR